jgi:inner membrane protein
MSWMTYWVWWIAAVSLAALEMFIPGVFMIWLAAAALVTGFLVALLGPVWQAQLAIFAVLAVVSIVIGRRFIKSHPITTQDTSLNRRAESLVGELVPVSEAIRNGRGKVMIGDSPWLANGPDADVGAIVRIHGVDGTTVQVGPV